MDVGSIKKTLDSPTGKALKEYLILQLETLKDIDNLEDATAVEVRAQKKAYNKLKVILLEVMTFSQEVKSKDPRDSFHIA